MLSAAPRIASSLSRYLEWIAIRVPHHRFWCPKDAAAAGVLSRRPLPTRLNTPPPPVPGPTGSTGPDLEHASRCHWRAVADALVLFSPACVEGWNGTSVYSITSSARASSVGGTVRPSA